MRPTSGRSSAPDAPAPASPPPAGAAERTAREGGRLAAAIALAALLATLLLVAYAAEGPRGTDQYWYVADVETLSAGGAPSSNTWFPMGLIRADADASGYVAPFYHNGPLLHLVAGLERYLPLSAYASWLWVNVLCLLVTVGVVWGWLRRRTSHRIAGWTAAFAALAPVAYWQTANVLRESWFGALSALALALFFLVPSRHRAPAEIALAFVLGLGALAHPMFAILLVLLLGVRAFEWLRRPRLGRLLLALPAVLALGTVQVFKERWFPSSFQPSLESIIVSAVPGVTNMAWHFSEVQVTLDGAFLLDKLLTAIDRQFGHPRQWLIYLPINAALLAWVLLMARHLHRRFGGARTGGQASGQADGQANDSAGGRAHARDRHPDPGLFVLLALGTFLGLYAAIVVLQQNHMRFQQLVAPAAFILIGHALHALVPPRRVPLLMAPVLLVCLAVSVLMARQLAAEAVTERLDRERTGAALDFVDADDRVLFVDIRQHDPLSFVLRPTPALFIRPALIGEAAARDAIARFDPTALVTREAALPYGLEGFERLAELDTASFGPMVVWQRRGHGD